MGLKQREPRTYATIISDGTIRVRVDESTPGAVRRDYELKDGTKGHKFELVFHELSGTIRAVYFRDGKFGMTLEVVIYDSEDIILQMPLSSNYAEDFMKKLPNIALEETVTLKPYSFTDDKKKLRKGISVSQKEVKITSFFTDADKNYLHGFPAPEKEVMDKDDWKVYFIQSRKFLREFIETNIIPMLGNLPEPPKEEEIDIPDEPFAEEEVLPDIPA